MYTLLEEFPDFLTSILKEILHVFSIPWNSPDHNATQSLTEILNIFNLHQLITFLTHNAGKTPDWIVYKTEQNYI